MATAPNSVEVASTSIEIRYCAVRAATMARTKVRGRRSPRTALSTSSTNTGTSKTSARYGPPVRWLSMYGEKPKT